MKAHTKEVIPDFTPIDFVIRIESREDVAVLWAAFNASNSDLRKHAEFTTTLREYLEKAIAEEDRMQQLFKHIDLIAKQHCFG